MEYSKEQLQFGKWLFAGSCEFRIGATKDEHIPDSNLNEIAFIGASNVGKSSLINALTNQLKLARTSNTPGRTQQLNFFELRDHLVLVDLPGYGYAKASKTDKRSWNKLMLRYLKGRVQLARVCLLIDARREVKKNDIEMMDLLDEKAVSYQIILTKTDKVTQKELDTRMTQLKALAPEHTALYPVFFATSSAKKQGFETLRAELSQFAKPQER